MLKVFLRNPMTQLCLFIIISITLLGIFAPWIAPHDPYENNILMKFSPPSWEYWLGTDQLGRCVFSRMLYGIRPTLFLSILTMLGTIGLGLALGVLAGYMRGKIDEIIMRVVDVMLSFPSQIMILAVVALLGVDIQNVILANIFIKWAWYARMIRTAVVKYTGANFVLFSRSIGSGDWYIMTRHMLPCISAELAGFCCFSQSRHGLGHPQHLHAQLPRTRRSGSHSGVGRHAQRSQECDGFQPRTNACARHRRRGARGCLQYARRQSPRRS